MRPDLRSVPRYFLNPSLPSFANGKAARVVDLSSKGCRLELVEPLIPGEHLYLQIIAGNKEITVEGSVLWCEIDSLLVDMLHDRYLVGIAFLRPSSAVEALVEELCGREMALRIEDFRDYDRYTLASPLTGSFGEVAPVSILDLSIRGARISVPSNLGMGSGAMLRFQIDRDSGTTEVFGKVMWTTSSVTGDTHAGLQITGADEQLRQAIDRLCIRGEARIDLDSLRRKFDNLRAQAARQRMAG